MMKFAPILLGLVGVASSEISTGENVRFDTLPTGSTSPADNTVSLPTIPAQSDSLVKADLQHVAVKKGKEQGTKKEHTKKENNKKEHIKKTEDNKKKEDNKETEDNENNEETEDNEDNEETEDSEETEDKKKKKKENKKARKDKKGKEDRVDDGTKKKHKDKKQSDKTKGGNKVAQPAETLSPIMSDHGTSSTSPTTKPITASPTERQVTPSPTTRPTTPSPTKATIDDTPVVPTTGASTVDPEFLLLLSKLPHAYPYTRFTPWVELESSEETIATNLGYDEDLWDNLERYDLEEEVFDNLSSIDKQDAASLGMDGNMWDCYMNHYGGLYWEDMVAEGVAQYWATLGWDQEGWDEGGNDPETEDMYWSDLSEEEKEAAYQLCFFDLSWDWVELPCWSQPQLEKSRSLC
mmetsp:Transcript_11568/g.20822  ORF Transcript_11568/g.20822 Transcript_11568/m.20822 type:complete len:408 (+) Transcript_11568:165-1388(+)